MATPYLHALSCSKCGAALSLSQNQQILTCQYCAQVHVFVPPPPPERPGTVYNAGERVAVEWGEHWWPATLLTPVGADEWRVHFEGWDQQYDVVVGPSRIRHISEATREKPRAVSRMLIGISVVTVLVFGATAFVAFQSGADQQGTAQGSGPGDPNKQYQVHQAVDIHYGSTWYAGRVLQVQGARYEVSYDGWSSTWNEWVDARRLRARALVPAAKTPAPPKEGTYAAGDQVQIEWNGSWYPGRIVEAAGARYKITYDGYASSWDEWVEVSRLRR